MQAASCIDATRGFSGALTISHSTFARNSLPHGSASTVNAPVVAVDCSGATHLADCNITVQDTVFHDNHAHVNPRSKAASSSQHTSPNHLGAGGALVVIGAVRLTVSGCSFQNNTAVSSGAAIHARDIGSVDISASSFGHNNAWEGHGGAVYIQGRTQLSIAKSLFHSNTAAASGGAVKVVLSRACKTLIQDSEFTLNAALSGGAVSLSGTGSRQDNVVEVRNSSFRSNAARPSREQIDCLENHCAPDDRDISPGEGGAVHSQGCSLLLNRSRFHANSAKFGGAVYASKAEGPSGISNLVEPKLDTASGLMTGDDGFPQSSPAGKLSPHGDTASLSDDVRMSSEDVTTAVPLLDVEQYIQEGREQRGAEQASSLSTDSADLVSRRRRS